MNHLSLGLELPSVALHACTLSRVWLFGIPWTVAHQAPLSMAFFRQEYWSGLPCSPPGDFPNPGIQPAFLMFLRQQAGSLPLVSPGKPLHEQGWVNKQEGFGEPWNPRKVESQGQCWVSRWECPSTDFGRGSLGVPSQGQKVEEAGFWWLDSLADSCQTRGLQLSSSESMFFKLDSDSDLASD